MESSFLRARSIAFAVETRTGLAGPGSLPDGSSAGDDGADALRDAIADSIRGALARAPRVLAIVPDILDAALHGALEALGTEEARLAQGDAASDEEPVPGAGEEPAGGARGQPGSPREASTSAPPEGGAASGPPAPAPEPASGGAGAQGVGGSGDAPPAGQSTLAGGNSASAGGIPPARGAGEEEAGARVSITFIRARALSLEPGTGARAHREGPGRHSGGGPGVELDGKALRKLARVLDRAFGKAVREMRQSLGPFEGRSSEAQGSRLRALA